LVSTTAHVVKTAQLMSLARGLAEELRELYQRRVNAGADPIGEAEEARRAMYEGLVSAGMMPRDAQRTTERFL
jgi:hypothetical protein